MSGNFNIVRYLLNQNEIDPNKTNIQEKTPIYYVTATEQNKAIANLMLSNEKVRINVATFNGQTPLHDACSRDDLTFARMLIRKGAKLTVQDNWGKTPIERQSALDKRGELVEEVYGKIAKAIRRMDPSVLGMFEYKIREMNGLYSWIDPSNRWQLPSREKQAVIDSFTESKALEEALEALVDDEKEITAKSVLNCIKSSLKTENWEEGIEVTASLKDENRYTNYNYSETELALFNDIVESLKELREVENRVEIGYHTVGLQQYLRTSESGIVVEDIDIDGIVPSSSYGFTTTELQYEL